MKINSYTNIHEVQYFEKFFIGLEPNQLNGFQSVFSEKIKKNYDSLQFKEAKNIYLELHSKQANKIKKNWKHDEVLLLLYIVDKMCLRLGMNFLDFDTQIWNTISQLIPGRNGEICRAKMLSLLPVNLNDTPWTQMEQQILAEIIQKQGIHQWKIIALKLFEKNPMNIYRSSKQCRERYMCFLKPNLKKGFWSEQQDYELIKLFLSYGRKWSKMTRFIQGRNQNAIKNRFFLLFQQNSRNQKLYYSEFMRKVLRRKEKLQKILGINQTYISQKPLEVTKHESESLQAELIKSDSLSTERESSKTEYFADIQQFLTF